MPVIYDAGTFSSRVEASALTTELPTVPFFLQFLLVTGPTRGIFKTFKNLLFASNPFALKPLIWLKNL